MTRSEPAAGDPLVPILIAGTGRSGSSALMQLLGTSPGIALDATFPHEARYFAYLFQLARAVDATEWPDDRWRFPDVAALSAGRDGLVGPPPWLDRAVIAPGGPGAETFGRRAFHALWREFSEVAREHARKRVGRPDAAVSYWAEKYSGPPRPPIESIMPVRLIRLLRDPRDVWQSTLAFDRKRGYYGFGRLEGMSDEEYLEWFLIGHREYLAVARESLEAGDAEVVRYEDLVQDPVGTSDRLSRWLDVPLDPARIDGGGSTRAEHMTSPTVSESVGRWRHEMAATMRARFSEALGAELEQLGYEP